MPPSSRFLAPLLPALVVAAGIGALALPPSAEGAPRADHAESPLRALPGPAPRGHGSDPSAENRACEGCHSEIASEWRGSMHQEAYVDPVFQEALALEPFPFCRGCHAPESDPRAEASPAAQEVGVGCTTCHVEGHDVVGVNDVPADGARHAVVSDARLATVDACARCHQFDFPAMKGAPMQNTVAEHASSKLASVTCQGCHMRPVGEGATKHLSHRFGVLSDPSVIRSAASVSARREGARSVRVSIEPANVGHAFPTGDMFRRLEVRAEAVDANGRVVERAPLVHLVRSFAERPKASREVDFSRVQVGDTRVPAPGAGDGRNVELRFERPTDGLHIRWTLVYQRMSTAMAASFGVEQARDEVVVAEGLLAPEPSR